MRTVRDLVVVGASAGGVEALRTLVAGLPSDLQATVLVVLHLPLGGRSALPAILDRAGPLAARHPVDGEPLPRGEVLVAPPDHHLLVHDGRVRLVKGPRENGHRPAIDPLFRSAAAWYGPRVVGLVLSGTLDDGTAGQAAVAVNGGTTLVQDPQDALYPDMPRSVLDHVAVDHVASAAALGPLVAHLCREAVEVASAPAPSPDRLEEASMGEPVDPSASADPPGSPAGLGCAACGGSLFEVTEGRVVRYRCRVGHTWSPESLLAEQYEALESALWLALRTLEDHVALCRRSQQHADERGLPRTAFSYRSRAAEAEKAADVIRAALEDSQRLRPGSTALG